MINSKNWSISVNPWSAIDQKTKKNGKTKNIIEQIDQRLTKN